MCCLRVEVDVDVDVGKKKPRDRWVGRSAGWRWTVMGYGDWWSQCSSSMVYSFV